MITVTYLFIYKTYYNEEEFVVSVIVMPALYILLISE